eukprot:g34719.t1
MLIYKPNNYIDFFLPIINYRKKIFITNTSEWGDFRVLFGLCSMPKNKKKAKTKTGTSDTKSKAAAPLPPVDERRLNSIYGAVDSGNIKSALKQIDGAVEKHGTEDVLMALKALCLGRTGKKDESMKLCKQLSKKEKLDARVHTPLLICSQELRAETEEIAIREKMCAHEPNDQKLALELHTVYGRAQMYDRQQKISMKLYSQAKDPKYLFWSGVAQLLVDRKSPVAPNTMLKLAETMILARLPKDQPWPTEQLLLIVQILMKQDKHQDALDVITGIRADELKKDIQEYLRWTVQLYEKLGQWNDVLRVRVEQLKLSRDDWLALQGYIEAATKLGQKAEEILEFLKTLQSEESQSTNPARSPFLAECELEFQSWRPGNKLLGISNSLCKYFRLFGHKSCFINDVVRYLQPFASAPRDAEKFMDELNAVITGLSEVKGDQRRDEHHFSRVISLYQCRSFTGLQARMSEAKLEAQAEKLWAMHLQAVQQTKSVISSERGVGDGLAHLCALTLFDLHTRTKQRKYLVEAIARLVDALKTTPNNFQIRLLLMRLYCSPMIGAVGLALKHFTILDVKQVLLDSCSHLILADAIRLLSEGAEPIVQDLLEYHASHNKQGPDLIKLAYSSNNFGKVLEFVELQDRLDASLQKAVAQSEKMHLSLVRLVSSADNLHSLKPANLFKYLQVAGDLPNSLVELGVEIANQDFNLVACYKSEAALRFAANCPSPSIFTDSFRSPGESLPDEGLQDYKGPNTMRSCFRLQHAIIGFLVRNNEHSSLLHEQIKSLLHDLGLLGVPHGEKGSLDSFAVQHWALVGQAFELDVALEELKGSEASPGVADKLKKFRQSLLEFFRMMKEGASKTINAPSVYELMLVLRHMSTYMLILLSKWDLLDEIGSLREDFQGMRKEFKVSLMDIHDQNKHALEEAHAQNDPAETSAVAEVEAEIFKDLCNSLSRGLKIANKHASLLCLESICFYFYGRDLLALSLLWKLCESPKMRQMTRAISDSGPSYQLL